MVSLLDLLPIITILTVGVGLWKVLNRFGGYNFRKTECFNIFLLLGSFSLIFPLTLIGIQPNGVLTISFFGSSFDLIDFKSWCLIYFLLGLIISIIIGYYMLRRILANLEHLQFELGTFKDYRFFLLGFLLFDYIILETILPLRGFDAFYYYFPEAEVFYQSGRITEVNYLSFLPVVKSPLNVLLYVYCYYVTNQLAIQIIPFLFLIGLVMLVYDFSLELFDNQSLALIAAIFMMTLPFTYWLMNLWAFYQDLYLSYFFSVACYFSLKWYKTPSKKISGLFMGIGIISAILTKITAWVLPLILILWLPTGKKGKILRLLIIPVLGAFLCIQAATRIYFGVALTIMITFGAVCYFIVKEKSVDYPTWSFIRILLIGIAMVIGSFWLNNRMSLSKSVWEEIYNLYFQLGQAIKWSYPEQFQNPLLRTLENVHGINFISAIGILFLGSVFVLPWFILKVFSLKDFRPITAPLIWILIFFGIWSTYYLDSSIRYLAPIIIPMILCISWGFYQLTNKIDSKTIRDFAAILFALLGCLSFYYLIPLESLSITEETQETVGFNYNKAALDYYSNPVILMILAIGISVIILIFLRKDLVARLLNLLDTKINKNGISMFLQNLVQALNSFRCGNYVPRASKILLLGAIIIPLAVQGYLLIYVQGDLAEFHAIHEYEYRPEYQELVTVIQQQNQPLAAILTVRTPGIQFFTKQPAIDIYYQRDLFQGDLFFTSTNLTDLIEVLRNPIPHIIETDHNFNLNVSLKFIVVPSIQNLYYDLFITQIKTKSVLFQSLDNSSSFTLITIPGNSDFLLYEVLF